MALGAPDVQAGGLLVRNYLGLVGDVAVVITTDGDHFGARALLGEYLFRVEAPLEPSVEFFDTILLCVE